MSRVKLGYCQAFKQAGPAWSQIKYIEKVKVKY